MTEAYLVPCLLPRDTFRCPGVRSDFSVLFISPQVRCSKKLKNWTISSLLIPRVFRFVSANSPYYLTLHASSYSHSLGLHLLLGPFGDILSSFLTARFQNLIPWMLHIVSNTSWTFNLTWVWHEESDLDRCALIAERCPRVAFTLFPQSSPENACTAPFKINEDTGAFPRSS
jgi:hypothetical protein